MNDPLPKSSVTFIERAISDGNPLDRSMLDAYHAQTGRPIPPGQSYEKHPVSVSTRPPTSPTEHTPKSKDSRFARIDNTVLQDARLSFRARGVLAYILSRPANWTHSAESLSRVGSEGMDAIRGALRELRECGYAELRKIRSTRGSVVHRWYFNESPSAVFPEALTTGKSRDLKDTVKKGDGEKAFGKSPLLETTAGEKIEEKRLPEREARSTGWPSALPPERAKQLAKDHRKSEVQIHAWFAIWMRKKLRYRDPVPASHEDAFDNFKDELHIDRNREPPADNRAGFADPQPVPPKWAIDLNSDRQAARDSYALDRGLEDARNGIKPWP